jgi:hypothetical protein
MHTVEKAGLVFIVGLIAAIVIPNVFPIRVQRAGKACINNLRQIDAAKQTWGLENNKKGKDTPSWDDMRVYLGRGSGQLPTCPEGGVYTINCLSNNPQCTVKGHVLPKGL